MIRHSSIGLAGAALCALLFGSGAFAASPQEIDTGVQQTLQQFYQINSTHKDLLTRAKGVLIFPKVTKGGVGVAGEFGEGALRVNGINKGYYSISSASVGLTLGLASHQEIIVFMTQESLDKFVASQGWSVGADTGVALMSAASGGGSYDTETLKKPILAFVFGTKGLIGDASLAGTKITHLDK